MKKTAQKPLKAKKLQAKNNFAYSFARIERGRQKCFPRFALAHPNSACFGDDKVPTAVS
ncbi:MAG: hypothetical protein ACI932_001447 [Paracoccaceae bacterium]|jgi:hypothetical protein